MQMVNKHKMKDRRLKVKKLYIAALIFAIFCVVGSAFAGYQTYGANYRRDMSLAQTGIQQANEVYDFVPLRHDKSLRSIDDDKK